MFTPIPGLFYFQDSFSSRQFISWKKLLWASLGWDILFVKFTMLFMGISPLTSLLSWILILRTCQTPPFLPSIPHYFLWPLQTSKISRFCSILLIPSKGFLLTFDIHLNGLYVEIPVLPIFFLDKILIWLI